MKKVIKGKSGRIVLGLLAAALLLLSIVLPGNGLPRDRDTEFRYGSNIPNAPLSCTQIESLDKLCKVWGYAKYHHPSVISGELNWDAELFRVMPAILDAQSSTQSNEVLLRWLEQFPIPAQEDDRVWAEVQAQYGMQRAQTAWIEDSAFLGEKLSACLCAMAKVPTAKRENAYASFDPEVGRVTFANEKSYPLHPQDMGMKLLGLFRFWNAYAYYSPNVGITVMDWDEVLKASIPRVAAAADQYSYVLAIAQTVAATGDAHASVYDSQQRLRRYYGNRYLPCSIKIIDGQAVVDQAGGAGAALQPGDILLAIDGMTVEERIAEQRPYRPLPQPDKLLLQMGDVLLGAKGEQAEVRVLRDAQEKTLHMETAEQPYVRRHLKSQWLADGSVGYIDPSALSDGDLEKLMARFQEAKGIIVDLRYDPSVFIPYLMGEFIVPSPTVFAIIGMPNQAMPGAYWKQAMIVGKGMMKELLSDDRDFAPYSGKIVLLMDEGSVSQSEFTIMALRQSPNAVVVGSPSAGADGDVTVLLLPGNLQVPISGLGVYTPEGGQTQRVGLAPDVYCVPTVEGLRAGQDELISCALDIISAP